MIISDWISGLALACFLAIPFGMIVALYASLMEGPQKYDPDAALISSLDIRRCLTAAGIFVVGFTIIAAFLFRADRLSTESWQAYIRDHKCVVIDSRTRTEYQSGGYPGTSRITTVTEYLWRCEGGDEHWHR